MSHSKHTHTLSTAPINCNEYNLTRLDSTRVDLNWPWLNEIYLFFKLKWLSKYASSAQCEYETMEKKGRVGRCWATLHCTTWTRGKIILSIKWTELIFFSASFSSVFHSAKLKITSEMSFDTNLLTKWDIANESDWANFV